MSTDVVERHVKPSTKAGRCSVWEAILAAESPSESDLVGTPRFMVSHAWSYNIQTLASIVRHHVGQDHSSDSAYFFLDFFCMNQHDLSDVMGRHLVQTDSMIGIQDALIDCLTRSITFGGLMLMALDSWKKPTTLSRCWCLYELYIAYTNNTKVVMALSPSAQANFVEALRFAPSSLLREAVSEVNVQQAKATVAADRDMILDLIRDVGFDVFDSFIRSKVVSSLRVAALSAAVGDSRRISPRPTQMTNSLSITGSSSLSTNGFNRACKAAAAAAAATTVLPATTDDDAAPWELKGMGAQLLAGHCTEIEMAEQGEQGGAPPQPE